MRGWRMRHGSVAIDEVAEITSPLAERILKAGAVVHARTTTPELSCAGFTHSELWGVTRNPWNTDVTAGGSSGGSGASLAAGSSMLASGSDIGGSIRLPSSMNGVVGFKPPHGRVPVDPPFNLDRYCHDGPMARTVTDCAVFENVLAGPHPMDVTSLRPKLRIPSTLKPIDGWRVAVCVNLGTWDVDEEVAANTRAVGDACEDAGAVVEEVELPWTMDQVKADRPPALRHDRGRRDRRTRRRPSRPRQRLRRGLGNGGDHHPRRTRRVPPRAGGGAGHVGAAGRAVPPLLEP